MTRPEAPSHAERNAASVRSERRVLAWAALALAVLVLLLFGDVLLSSDDRVASYIDGDTARYFIWFRQFGFGELARGNLPLWNPYIFAGAPLLAGFQSALLYPPNVIYLLLPLDLAINLDLALHVLLAGLFTFAWVRARSLHPLAAFFSAVLLVSGSAFSLRVLAGQLTVVAAMAWAPLLLLAVDRIFERPSLGWILVGILATTLQMLSGYPACVHATGFAVGLYAGLRLIRCSERMRVVAALAAVALAPLFLSAAQLWTGLEIAAETVRAGGVAYGFATTFSLPPENLVTLLAPGFFGDVLHVVYWGRWYFWDAAFFIGIVGLVLAVHGAMRGSPEQKRFAAVLVLILVLVSLGRYTPLYRLLHAAVPGFDAFRAPSKFLFQASLFAALLAGVGADRLLAGARGTRALAIAAFATTILLALAAIWATVFQADEGGFSFGNLVATMAAHPHRAPGDWARSPSGLVPVAARFAATGLWIATGSALVTAALLWARRRTGIAAHVLLIVGIAELLLFAASHRSSFPVSQAQMPGLEASLRELGPDQRFFFPPAGDRLLPARIGAVWGYDPVMLRRHVEVVAFAQTKNSKPITYTLRLPRKFHPVFAMLRCPFEIDMEVVKANPVDVTRYRSVSQGAQFQFVRGLNPLPRFLLVRDYRVTQDRDEALRRLFDASFDFRRTVLLEREPNPRPQAGREPGRIERLEESTDHVSLEIELDAAAILLITDTYSEGWRVRALAPGPQSRYEIQPANHSLRAIPLAAGRHRLRIEYAPLGFRAGRVASLASSALFLAATGWWAWRRRATAGT